MYSKYDPYTLEVNGFTSFLITVITLALIGIAALIVVNCLRQGFKKCAVDGLQLFLAATLTGVISMIASWILGLIFPTLRLSPFIGFLFFLVKFAAGFVAAGIVMQMIKGYITGLNLSSTASKVLSVVVGLLKAYVVLSFIAVVFAFLFHGPLFYNNTFLIRLNNNSAFDWLPNLIYRILRPVSYATDIGI